MSLGENTTFKVFFLYAKKVFKGFIEVSRQIDKLHFLSSKEEKRKKNRIRWRQFTAAITNALTTFCHFKQNYKQIKKVVFLKIKHS